MSATGTHLRFTETPMTAIQKRNPKIRKLLYAVLCAVAAAVCLLFAPELGSTAAIVASLVAGGSSAAFTMAARHTHD